MVQIDTGQVVQGPRSTSLWECTRNVVTIVVSLASLVQVDTSQVVQDPCSKSVWECARKVVT